MSHPISHSETGTHREKSDTVIPTSGKKIHPPGCRSQGLTPSPAPNPYQPRKGLDLDPAIERIKKTKKGAENLVINLPFHRIQKQFYIPKTTGSLASSSMVVNPFPIKIFCCTPEYEYESQRRSGGSLLLVVEYYNNNYYY